MKNKIKEKVLKTNLKHGKNPINFFKWAYGIKNLRDLEYDLGLLIDLTLASVGKVIDERIKEIEEDVRNWKQFVDYKTLKEKAHERIKELKELKQKLRIEVLK